MTSVADGSVERAPETGDIDLVVELTWLGAVVATWRAEAGDPLYVGEPDVEVPRGRAWIGAARWLREDHVDVDDGRRIVGSARVGSPYVQALDAERSVRWTLVPRRAFRRAGDLPVRSSIAPLLTALTLMLGTVQAQTWYGHRCDWLGLSPMWRSWVCDVDGEFPFVERYRERMARLEPEPQRPEAPMPDIEALAARLAPKPSEVAEEAAPVEAGPPPSEPPPERPEPPVRKPPAREPPPPEPPVEALPEPAPAQPAAPGRPRLTAVSFGAPMRMGPAQPVEVPVLSAAVWPPPAMDGRWRVAAVAGANFAEQRIALLKYREREAMIRHHAVPNDVAAMSQLAATYYLAGRNDLAARFYRDLMNLEPRNAEWVIGFTSVVTYETTAELRDAQSVLEMALSFDEANPRTLCALALNMLRQGEVERASELTVKATRGSDEPHAWLHRAVVATAAGRPADAQRALERALNLAEATGMSDDLVFLHFLVREPLFAPLRTNPRVIKLLEAHGVDAKTLGTTMGFADPDPAGDPTGRRRGPRADRPDRRPEAGEPQDGDEPRERGNKPARGGRADRPRRGDRGPDAPVEPSPP